MYVRTDEPSKPGAPDIVDWDIDFVKLSWTPPVKDGGAPIVGYAIVRKDKYR